MPAEGGIPYHGMEGGNSRTAEQQEEDGEMQRSDTALSEEHQEEELGTPRTGTIENSRPSPEEVSEDMETSARGEAAGATEPNLPQTGQDSARKRKLSKDREPTKVMPQLSGHREENTRDKQSSSQTERDWMKKLGDKARRVWRTSPPPES